MGGTPPATLQTADFTAFEAWALTPHGDMLLVDVLRERLEGPDQIPALKRFCARWDPHRVLIESMGYQLSFVQSAIREGLPAEEVRRERGEMKVAWAIPLATLMEEGRVYLLGARDRIEPPWLKAFETELLSFPGGSHDDMVDAAGDAAREVALGRYAVLGERASGVKPLANYLARPFGPFREEMFFGTFEKRWPEGTEVAVGNLH